MKRYIFPILVSLAGLSFAASHALRKPADEGEKKVSLGDSFYAGLQEVSSPQYPRRVQAGSPDGIPYGLRLDNVKDKTVSISWNSPEAMDGYFEDFEGHDDFAVNSTGTIGWSYIDGDNKFTYSWSACTYKNQGQKMAFIVMNPKQTTPSVEGNPNFIPTSGDKMLVCMSANGAANNDWIVSPELSFDEDFHFSFQARSYRTEGFGAERIRVGYSTSGKTQSSFRFLTPSPYLELPAEWQLYEYSIPREAKYVAINCVSDDAFMLLIDDIMIGTNEIRPAIKDNGPLRVKGRHLTGFNVYRDGRKVNTQPVKEVRYTDKADTYAVHSYTVTALYSDGTESAKSTALDVDVADPRLLPFFDDFDDWTMDKEKWSTPENPIGAESNWGIDYYTYGLVDPSATYGYSSLRDYDQSLITRELRTLDRKSTYLRFDLRLCNWGVYPEENNKLDLQITCDGGRTWTTIDTYDNLKGEFNWTLKEYSLASYLTSDIFQLRWRAYGAYAMHIDYWYVDDVKVWNPSWGSLKLTLTSSAGAMANTAVTLRGEDGGVYNLTTDASGCVNLGQIEADTYAITIVKSGYNTYNGSVEVKDGQASTKDIRLTQPSLRLSTTSVSPEMAVEEKRTEHFTISNTGDGPMTWRMNYAPAKQSGKAVDFQIHNAWNGSGDLQTSIGFDGEYYYTTSWYYLGEFWKYDRQGNLIEQFRIPDMYYKLYDLAYDGRYFYGSDYSNRLFQLDFDNKCIVGIIEISNAPELNITHVAYNPNNDRFYVGSWNTLCEVRRNGRATTMDAPFDSNESHAIYGSAYDNVTPGGPYLWLTAVESYNENMLDKVLIYQYSLVTKKFTGLKKVVTDLPGYKVGSVTSGINNICGLEGSYDIESGKFTLVGALQQSPSLFFEYNVAECDTWLDFMPRKATLQAGQSMTIDVNLDARDGVVGTTYSNAITINTVPELAKQTITLGYKATKASSTPRPTGLSATDGTSADKVTLAWSKPAASPLSYKVYRNGKAVAEGVKSTTYTDAGLVRGTYDYYVTAVYATGESVPSDHVSHLVKQGAPYYAPVGLTSTISGNRQVTLNWLSPLWNAPFSGTLQWGSGNHADQVGLSSGGNFYAGLLWDATDMLPYRNKLITRASVRIVNPVQYLALCIFKDGERIARKVCDGEITYGDWTTIQLDTPISIEPGSDYIVAFQMEHAAGLQPVGMDDTEAVDGKGNLLSMDGQYWFPSSQMAIDGNLNIRFDVEATAQTEASPIGYNVYRDGIKVNTQPVAATTFAEALAKAGTYVYRVSSVYAAGGESPMSDSASVRVIPIAQRFAPSTVTSTVECNRGVSLFWDFPTGTRSSFPVSINPQVTTTESGYPTYVGSFLAQGGELAVASDGRTIYTSVHTDNGRINQYDLNGKFQGHFYIPGLEGIRNIAFDGTDFWVATTNTNIYRVDMQAHRILDTKPISEYARHLAYIPDLDGGRGGFEVGDWATSIYVSRQGAKLGDGPVLKGSAGTAYHDGLLYSFEQGGLNPRTIVIYDFHTSARVGEIDLEKYSGLSNIESAVAGGMSVIHTPEGLTFLAVAVQNTQSSTEILFLDIAGVAGVEGYNVYRNGRKVNSQPLTQRFFQETLTQQGSYDYQVETVYIDGTVSPLSPAERVTIVPVGTALPPTDLKVVPTTYGYDVALSFADPALATDCKLLIDFEGQTPAAAAAAAGATNAASAWKVSDHAYHGQRSITAERDTEASFLFPASGYRWIDFCACNADDHQGPATIQVLASEDTGLSNFVLVDEFPLTEPWHQFGCQLPEGTRYVMLRKPAAMPQCFVDAIRFNPGKPESKVWGYDIFRDGKKVNQAPVRDISYVDHNLVPGTYHYQVRQQSVTSALSPLTGQVALNLRYSNGGQAPEFLQVLSYSETEARLDWKSPALGDAVNLRWHTGNSYDAAGLPNGGAFYAGVRWLAKDIKDYAHLSLSEVEVYVNQIPDALYLLVYQGNSLVHRQYVQHLRQYSFNTIQLTRNIPMDVTKELRVIVYVEHNEITVPLGYDEGPAQSGRGNLYSTDGISYTTMDDEETGISGNWNISIGLRPYSDMARAKTQRPVSDDYVPLRSFPTQVDFDAHPLRAKSLAAPAPVLRSERAQMRVASTMDTFLGYNVYSNGRLMNESPIPDTQFTAVDDYLLYPYFQFRVSAVYSMSGEAFSNSVTIAPTETDIQRVGDSHDDVELYYDLQGRKLGEAPTRGLFIHAGKKVMK